MVIDEYNDGFKQNSLYKIFGANNLINKKLDKLFKKYSITASQFNIMMVIKHQCPKEGTNQVEIAKRLVVCASNITKLIEKLYQQEYINRELSKVSRRNNVITITQKGSDLLDEIWPEYVKVVEEITSPLSESERKTLTTLLTKWQQGLA